MTAIRSLEELLFDEHNANLGTPRGRDLLEDSLRELGAGRSVLVDKDGRLIAGNKTVEAARRLGYTDVVIVPTDGKTLVAVQRTDLDLENDPRAKLLGIADNRVAEADLLWDLDALEQMADQGVSLSTFWSDEEWDLMADPFDTESERPQHATGGEDTDELPANTRSGVARETTTQDARYPLAVVLDRKTYERWISLKARLKLPRDTDALTRLLEVAEALPDATLMAVAPAKDVQDDVDEHDFDEEPA